VPMRSGASFTLDVDLWAARRTSLPHLVAACEVGEPGISALGSRAVISGRCGECLSWAESAPRGVASGRTGVRAIADIQLRARSTLHRPERKFPTGSVPNFAIGNHEGSASANFICLLVATPPASREQMSALCALPAGRRFCFARRRAGGVRCVQVRRAVTVLPEEGAPYPPSASSTQSSNGRSLPRTASSPSLRRVSLNLLFQGAAAKVGRADNATRPRMRCVLRKPVIFFENLDTSLGSREGAKSSRRLGWCGIQDLRRGTGRQRFLTTRRATARLDV
jgi:hypothetical protein